MEHVENMPIHNENAAHQHVGVSKFGEQGESCSSHFTHVFGSKQCSKDNSLLAIAFDKSNTLELHLKWTQAFFACGISFNVMRNPIFQEALMCTAHAGSKFTIPPYNKMQIEYLDKIKHTMEQSIARTILNFVPSFGCTTALDGWTSC